MAKKTPKDPNFVNIAKLKANLAAYLRKAEGGESITVVDRHRPIARLVGLESEREELRTIPPTSNPSEVTHLKLNSIKTQLPDVVEFLIRDRRKR